MNPRPEETILAASAPSTRGAPVHPSPPADEAPARPATDGRSGPAPSRTRPARSALGKRLFDLALLLPTLPFWTLATGVLALAVRVADGAPAFYPQERVGRGRRPFRIFKLRTLTCEADPADRRPTRLGAFLRRRGLDEIPQVYNVLLGHMSLVGPRPLTAADADRLTRLHPPFAARFAVPPGITGLAQVCLARGAETTARLEAMYVREHTHLGDLSILMRTLWINVVGKQRGARPPPEAP